MSNSIKFRNKYAKISERWKSQLINSRLIEVSTERRDILAQVMSTRSTHKYSLLISYQLQIGSARPSVQL